MTLDDRLRVAGQLAVRARIFFDIWWLYEGKDTRPSVIDAMNEYPAFFRYDSHAHLVAVIIHLAALLETRSDTINVGALIGEAATNGVPPATIAAAQNTLAALVPMRRSVMILRNNLFGHRSASLSYVEAFRKASVAPHDLREALHSILGLVNALERARGLAQQRFTDHPRNNMRKLLHDIAKRQLT